MAFTTLVELYREAFHTHPRPDAFRYKSGGAWHQVSSAEARARIERVAAALHGRGVAPGDRVVVLSENRLEWALADFGILTAGAATVPIYATLSESGMRHILADSGARIAIVSTARQRERVLALLPELPALRTLVLLDPPDRAAAPDGGTAHLEELSWDEFLAEGRQRLAADAGLAQRLGDAVRPGQMATLIYTSGTTGAPKGVILTHANLCSNVRDALLDFEIGPADSTLSVLPLSHILERMAGQFTMVSRAVSIAYAENVDTFAANLLEIRPTIAFAVPRIFEKFYGRVLDAAMHAPLPRRVIFFRARAVAWQVARTRLRGREPGGLLRLQHALYDRLVYARIRARLGGRMRFFVSGGAPLNPEIAEFFIGSGVMVIEGYGLTETSPVLTVNRLDRNRPGTVGPPIANVEIRIAEDGEILARGPGVMQGYYRLPAETEQALAGGWFHTGDIGHLDPDGFLVITDRKKDLLVTAGGKNVAPQPIENALKNIRYVAEAVLLGDRRPYCVALIVPDFQQLEAWARYKRVPFATRAELLARPEVVQMYERRIADATQEFARYEKVKRFALLDHDFTIAEGELTPTLKVRRRIISEHYAATIESLYQEPEEAGEEPASETPGGSP